MNIYVYDGGPLKWVCAGDVRRARCAITPAMKLTHNEAPNRNEYDNVYNPSVEKRSMIIDTESVSGREDMLVDKYS